MPWPSLWPPVWPWHVFSALGMGKSGHIENWINSDYDNSINGINSD
jgi:hypothetical protein